MHPYIMFVTCHLHILPFFYPAKAVHPVSVLKFYHAREIQSMRSEKTKNNGNESRQSPAYRNPTNECTTRTVHVYSSSSTTMGYFFNMKSFVFRQNKMPLSKSYPTLARKGMGYMFYIKNLRSRVQDSKSNLLIPRSLFFQTTVYPCVAVFLSLSLCISCPSFFVLIVMHHTLPEHPRGT